MAGLLPCMDPEEEQNVDLEQSSDLSKYSYSPSVNAARNTDSQDSLNNNNIYLNHMPMKCFTGEKHLANGDFYSGSWKGHLPDGSGKYLWADGCMYEGEWQKGKNTGRGKVYCPSGATYEGDFMGCYIHGMGTFTDVDGSTYKGNWRMSRKHGHGEMRYTNGDVYEGSWKVGAQDGPGKYIWVSGNEFMGEWKEGIMCGKGFLTWAKGDVFDGEWLNGVEHGYGIYYWQDKSFYVGTWSRGLKDGKGIFYPSEDFPLKVKNSVTATFRDKNLRKELIEELITAGIVDIRSMASLFDSEEAVLRTSRKNSRATSSEKRSLISVHSLNPSLPRNKRLERKLSLEGSTERLVGLGVPSASWKAGEPILESKVNSFGGLDISASPILKREYVQGVLISETVKLTTPIKLSKQSKSKRWLKRHEKEVKRPGETIFKGHRSYDLMLSLQLGIRYTVGKMMPEPKQYTCFLNYGARASDNLRFPRFGSKLTPCHRTMDFTWKDYCPKIFRNLRETFKIDLADYMLSLCGNDALRELSSPGKSGSIFFLSNDDRFMIKTLRKSEVQVLLNMLPSYHDHVHAYENTLITKFFGLHRVRPRGGRKVRFVVMGNMFCTDLHIHRRYDLKGSRQGRRTDKTKIDENTTLKDMDLDLQFFLQPSWRASLLKQIECDCKFLESERIMDYSLLLGVHFRAPIYPLALQTKSHTATNIDRDAGFCQLFGVYTHDFVISKMSGSRRTKAAPAHNPFDSSDDESVPPSGRAPYPNPFDDDVGVRPQRSTNPFDDEPKRNAFAHQPASTNPFDDEEQPKRAAVASNPLRTRKLASSDRKNKDLRYGSSSNPFDDEEDIPSKPGSGTHKSITRESRSSFEKQSNSAINLEAYNSASLSSDPKGYQSKTEEDYKFEAKEAKADPSSKSHHTSVKEKFSSISDGVANRAHRLKQGTIGQFKDANAFAGNSNDSEKPKKSVLGGSTARNLLLEGDIGKRQHLYPRTQGGSRFEQTHVGASGLEGQSVQELENYALHKSEETTSTVYNCLKIAEDTKEVAVKTSIQLHEQGVQIQRTHDTAVEVDLELRKGEKLLGSLGGLFSKTWKPKKTKNISGPSMRSDSFKRKAYGLEQRAALGLTPGNTRGKIHRSSVADLSQSQNQILLEAEKSKQDDALLDLSNVLGQLKDMTLDMGKEIERQSEDLDNLHGDVTELGFRVKGANERGRRLLGR